MHDRAQTVVASSPGTDLVVDRRPGRNVFMRSLVAGEPADDRACRQ
jgi:hypothetical protein